MSSRLSRYEEDEGTEPEITLSTASLLGLFLGLVLICGVFFGFGFFMGSRSTASAVPTPKVFDGGDQSAAQQTAKPSSAPVQNTDGDMLPASASDTTPTTDTSSPVGSDPYRPSRLDTAAQGTQPVPLPEIEQPAPVAPEVRTVQPEKPAPKAPALAKAASPAAAPRPVQSLPVQQTAQPAPREAMVQVAAVVHQGDAQVLVSALRQHGYSAVVRNEPQDKLLHIQVGPFPTRVQANMMRQKLLSDGYDAIIKQ